MLGTAEPKREINMSDEEYFLCEMQYIAENIDSEASKKKEKLEDIYFPIHLSEKKTSFRSLWNDYARYEQGLTIRSNLRDHLDPTHIDPPEYNYPQKYKHSLAILSQTVNLVDEFNEKHIRKGIFGSPGSGKSLFCARLVLACIKNEIESKRFPVLLRCRSLNRVDATGFKLFYDFAYVMSSTDLSFERFKAILDEHVVKGDLLLIIDGFDELSHDNKINVSEKTADFLGKPENSLTDMIVTGRLLNYNDEEINHLSRLEPGLCYHYIHPMTNHERVGFIATWVFLSKDRRVTESDLELVSETEKELDSTENIIKDLSYFPMYLSNLLEIKEHTGHIPKSMSEYNESFIKKFARRAEVAEDSTPFFLIIKYIAYRMTFDRDDISIIISRDELINYIKECYGNRSFCRSFPRRIDDKEAERIVNVMINDMGVFVSAISHRGEDFGLQFLHLTVQELFASMAVNNSLTPDGSGSLEFFRYKFGNNVQDIESNIYPDLGDRFIKIAENLILFSNKTAKGIKTSEEIEKILIEKKSVFLLMKKLGSQSILYYPKQVLSVLFGEHFKNYLNDITFETWLSSELSCSEEYRIAGLEIAMKYLHGITDRKDKAKIYLLIDSLLSVELINITMELQSISLKRFENTMRTEEIKLDLYNNPDDIKESIKKIEKDRRLCSAAEELLNKMWYIFDIVNKMTEERDNTGLKESQNQLRIHIENQKELEEKMAEISSKMD